MPAIFKFLPFFDGIFMLVADWGTCFDSSRASTKANKG